jgi:putative addiction module CopG family antidote
MTRPTLNVTLTPALRAFIAAQVVSDHYGTASEVVRAALRSLERQLSTIGDDRNVNNRAAV